MAHDPPAPSAEQSDGRESSPEAAASFRDPSGFVYRSGGILYRQVNPCYRQEYDHLIGSGLYEALAGQGLLIPHKEVPATHAASPEAYKVLQPERVEFISYPYEWCFSQLREAALATLAVQRGALSRGMSLKDCSAYNVQFRRGKAVFIDTLSFQRCPEGEPWVAYRQFCQHFLAPLALMSLGDARLGRLSCIHLDGVPLDLAARLLGLRARLRWPLLVHIVLHAATGERFAQAERSRRPRSVSRASLLGLLDDLERAVRGMRAPAGRSAWAGYYHETNYTDAGMRHKADVVSAFFDEARPAGVWDLGANTGAFSRIAGERGIPTVAMDSDAACVEALYGACVARSETCVLPLVVDLCNPSPGIGWAHRERMSLAERGPVDTALALALLHHLVIGNNVPLAMVARFLGSLCRTLLIEFVPKSDAQVRRMLHGREEVFAEYCPAVFETEFARHFAIEKRVGVRDSERVLYLMRRRGGVACAGPS